MLAEMIVTNMAGMAGLFDLPSESKLMGLCSQGGADYYLTYGCWAHPVEWWQRGGIQQPVAPRPPADALTNPTGAYYDGGQLAQSLNDQAIYGTQAQALANMQALSSDPNSPDGTGSGIPTWVWVAVAGVGVLAIVAIGGGSPGRYGR